MITQAGNASGVVAVPIFVGGTHLRHEQVYFALRALDGSARFEAADDENSVSPLADVIPEIGLEEFDALAGGEGCTEVE